MSLSTSILRRLAVALGNKKAAEEIAAKVNAILSALKGANMMQS